MECEARGAGGEGEALEASGFLDAGQGFHAQRFRKQGGYARLLPVIALLMLSVGMLAALGPARRGLRIQPTEALRED